MNFKKNNSLKRISATFAWLLMYFIFTSILYFALVILKRIPATWNYLSVMIITIIIVLAGKLIKWWLNKHD